ncbi:unnamed protein product [Arabidopsis thaliana]|uniref:Cytochrome P450 n=1 Tax=Arabidopsis thaliana TaxID=3702 RepID=A0A654GB42_ARATH|nr:unnamed protein product [Arabidopsis thaliana]VYS70055.1 unnamed protein product [Arabidopsis thaliana]
MYRHVKPRFSWKLQSWIGVGMEKKMIEAGVIFDRVCGKYISARREEVKRSQVNNNDHFIRDSHANLLTSHIKLDTTQYQLLDPINDKFLRDNVFALLLAGRDTTASALTWFFWFLSENPLVVTKIRQEIDMNLPRSCSGQERPSCDPMEYLNKDDESCMGRRCIRIQAREMDFRDRRVSIQCRSRICHGKQRAMVQMKIVAVEILQNYDIKVANGQKFEPDTSLILKMKHGFKVKINKRCSS